jgi:16S rRNA (cytosine967-C5)-methyltransferase
VVEDFLAAHPDYAADDLSSVHPVWKHPTMPRTLQTLPHRDRTDGFFIARFTRA